MEQTEEYKRLYALLSGLSSKARGGEVIPMISLSEIMVSSSRSSRRSTPSRSTKASGASEIERRKHSDTETRNQTIAQPLGPPPLLGSLSSASHLFSPENAHVQKTEAPPPLSSDPHLREGDCVKFDIVPDGDGDGVKVILEVLYRADEVVKISDAGEKPSKRKYVRRKATEDAKDAKASEDLKDSKSTKSMKKTPLSEGPLTSLFAPTDTLSTLTAALEARCRDLVTDTVADLSRALALNRGQLTLKGATLSSFVDDTLLTATQTWDGRCHYCGERASSEHFIPSSSCYGLALGEFKRRVASLS